MYKNGCVYKVSHNFAGETKTNEEFIATNPNKMIPSIDDNGFTLFERSVQLNLHKNKI